MFLLMHTALTRGDIFNLPHDYRRRLLRRVSQELKNRSEGKTTLWMS